MFVPSLPRYFSNSTALLDLLPSARITFDRYAVNYYAMGYTLQVGPPWKSIALRILPPLPIEEDFLGEQIPSEKSRNGSGESRTPIGHTWILRDLSTILSNGISLKDYCFSEGLESAISGDYSSKN